MYVPNYFGHVLGSRSYVSGLLIDTRVVALLGLLSHRDLIAGQVIFDFLGRQILGVVFPFHAFDVSRTSLGHGHLSLIAIEAS